MDAWVRVLVALVVPVAWGLVTAWFFDWLRRRRERLMARAATAAPTAKVCSDDEAL